MPLNMTAILSIASLLGLLAVGQAATGYDPIDSGWNHWDMMNGEGHHGHDLNHGHHDDDHEAGDHTEECEQYQEDSDGNSTESERCF